MSVLTKISVVLLTICSLLLSAAVVVFVNRVEDYKKLYEGNAAAITDANQASAKVSSALAEEKRLRAQDALDAAGRVAEKDRAVADLNTRLAEKDTVIAGLNKEKDIAATANKGVVDALRASETQNQDLQKLIADVRSKYDDVVKQFGQLNTAITVGDNKNRALEKALAYEQERGAALESQLKDLQAKMPGVASAGGGGIPSSPEASGGAVPDIKGVVRAVDMISGKKYATISVGSSSGVTKGMRFTAMNHTTGEFLGYVTIDNVQPDESIGQVEGPKVEKVQKDIDVRTQL